MTSTRSGKTPDGSPSPSTPHAPDRSARGLLAALTILGGSAPGERRARAEVVAEAMLALRQHVADETLA
jgi:hypothetical protein